MVTPTSESHKRKAGVPTKRLPSRPDLEHLKNQAKDLRVDHRAGKLDACQRIREFHPRYSGATDAEIGLAAFTLSDAYLTIAREYGFKSWARLRRHVERPDRNKLNVPHHERIGSPAVYSTISPGRS